MTLMADNIGMELRLWRKKVGLTQEELAERIDATRAQLAQWERGHTNPSFEFKMKLKALGMNAIPGVAEAIDAYNPGPDPYTLAALIDTVADCAAAPDTRANARRALYRLLKLPDNLS